MKKFKQALALGLIGAISIMGVGCGDSKTASSDAAASETPAESEVASESPEASEEAAEALPTDKYPAKDLNGRTFTFAYNWDPMPKEEPDPSTATVEDIYKWENLKRVEEKYNCKIEFINVPWEELDTKLTTSVMAGDPYADGVMLEPAKAIPLAVSGQIMAIEDINLPEADIFNDNYILLPGTEIAGKHYSMIEHNEEVSACFLGVNEDIINELGVEDPVELYEKGEWTWDKFLEIAKAATKDTDGDNVVDQYGLSGVPLVLAKQFIASNDGFLVDDTNLKEGLSDPKTMEALEFFNKLYNTDKVAYLANNDVWEWNGNLQAYREGKSAMYHLQSWVLGEGDNGSFNYSVVPYPTGPSNTSGSTYLTATGGVAIPRGVENPEDVLMIFEEVQDWYGGEYEIKAEASREWLSTLFKTEKDMENAIAFSEGGKVDVIDGVTDYPINTVVGNLLEDGQTVAQAVEANKQLAQDSIEAVFKKDKE